MGRKFFEGDVPRIASALERIAIQLEKQNTPCTFVPIDLKVKVYDAILKDDAEGVIEGWDGQTFQSIHGVKDANVYLEEVHRDYGLTGCNEVIEYLEHAWSQNK